MKIRALSASEIEWANRRYAEINFLASQPGDFIAVAEVDGAKAGLGRLVAVDGETAELGGIYVLPQFRGQKVARAIVSFLLEHSPYRRLFCIPFAHLEGFYRGFGFAPAACGMEIPKAVSAKVNWCTSEYPDNVALLVRDERTLSPGCA